MNNSRSLQTERLTLIAATAEHLRSELEAPEKLGELLGAEVPASWPPGVYDRDAMVFLLGETLKGGESAAGWLSYYGIVRSVHNERPLLVAAAGYFGPPSDEGTVEIGYSIADEARRKGYATEVVRALTERAFTFANVARVVAEADRSNVGSTRALLRCGFEEVGAGREPDHLRFEKRRSES
ncbi:MAG: GNAT family N-acetyltransferase [Polyangiaceae bacterium]|nr:GNAT family N-acetyltransferase [Polyangiaceae bacterium]